MPLGFDVSVCSPKQKKAILDEIARVSLISPEKMEAMHVVMGDDVFFMLLLMSGEEIRFPPQRTLRKIYTEALQEGATDEREEA